MSDFYSVLVNSLSRADLQDPVARERVFVHARMAMIRRLWSFEPPLSNEEIEEKIGLFDSAVRRLEADIAAGVERLKPSVALVASPRPAPAPPLDDDPWDEDRTMPEVAAPQLSRPEGLAAGAPAEAGRPGDWDGTADWGAASWDLDEPVNGQRTAVATEPAAASTPVAFDWPEPLPAPVEIAATELAPPVLPVPLPPSRSRGRDSAGTDAAGDPSPGRWSVPAEGSRARPSGAAAARALIERGMAWRPRRAAAPEQKSEAPRPQDRSGGLLGRLARRRGDEDATRHLVGRIRPPRAASAMRGAAAEEAASSPFPTAADGSPAAAAARPTQPVPDTDWELAAGLPEPVEPPPARAIEPAAWDREAADAAADWDAPAEAPLAADPPSQAADDPADAWEAGAPDDATGWQADTEAGDADAPWHDIGPTARGWTAAPEGESEADDGFGPPLVGPPEVRPAAPSRGPRRAERADADAAEELADGAERAWTDRLPFRLPRGGALPVGRLLAAGVAVLAIVVVAWSAFLLVPLFFGSAGDRPPEPAAAADAGGSTAGDPPRLGGPAADVAETIVLFSGLNPTVFESSPDNPVHFDGDTASGYARVASSAASAGARAVVGPGIADRVAGRTVRITVVARSSTDQGAGTIRFAYLAGTTISPWKTALLDDTYSALDLTWQVPPRSGDGNDYLIIEPGVPGEGTGADIQEIRIDILKE
jgi:hypothetical protein